MRINLICSRCGNKHGKHRGCMSTWHINRCDVCGVKTDVTEGRDFRVYEIDGRKIRKKIKYDLVNDLIAAWGEVPLDNEGVEQVLNEALSTAIDQTVMRVLHSDETKIKNATKEAIINDVLEDYVG